jgi:hypothetical protein
LPSTTAYLKLSLVSLQLRVSCSITKGTLLLTLFTSYPLVYIVPTCTLVSFAPIRPEVSVSPPHLYGISDAPSLWNVCSVYHATLARAASLLLDANCSTLNWSRCCLHPDAFRPPSRIDISVPSSTELACRQVGQKHHIPTSWRSHSVESPCFHG